VAEPHRPALATLGGGRKSTTGPRQCETNCVRPPVEVPDAGFGSASYLRLQCLTRRLIGYCWLQSDKHLLARVRLSSTPPFRREPDQEPGHAYAEPPRTLREPPRACAWCATPKSILKHVLDYAYGVKHNTDHACRTEYCD